MAQRRLIALLVTLAFTCLAATGCRGRLDENIARLNAAATAAAGGGPTPIPATQTSTPEPTAIPQGYFDLTADPSALLVWAWGQVYGLPSGEEFTIIATQEQVASYVVQSLQLGGFQNVVRGGTVTVGLGQIRLDLALQDMNGNTDAGTITFQPTLDAQSTLALHPQGADFGGLQLPGDFIPALGDTVHAVLTGAQTPALSQVRLTLLGMDNGVLRIAGTVK